MSQPPGPQQPGTPEPDAGIPAQPWPGPAAPPPAYPASAPPAQPAFPQPTYPPASAPPANGPPPGYPASAPPGYPASAPPGYPPPAFPPASGIPGYPPAQPPAASGNRGTVVGIIAGAVVLVLVLCGAGFAYLFPKINAQIEAAASADASPTPDLSTPPAVGACWKGTPPANGFNNRAELSPGVDCATDHTVETIAAGHIDTRPAGITSPQTADLFATCEDAAEKYLGQPWAATFAWLALAVPSSTQWDLGAHWYRCDLGLTASFQKLQSLTFTGPLKATVTPIGCLGWVVNAAATNFSRIESVDCTVAHNGELAGVVRFPEGSDPHGDDDATLTQLSHACEPLVDAYFGGSLPDSLTVWFVYPEGTLQEGTLNQYVPCIISADDLTRKFTATLKSNGGKPIPFA